MLAVIAPGAMRVTLSLLVVATHYLDFLGYRLVVPVDGPAVYGFFFLSGYWVSKLWAAKYTRAERPWLTFYVSRAWRIYPLAVLATALMTYAAAAPPIYRLASSLLLVDYWAPLNPPAWSLAIEVQFYLVAPALFALMRRSFAAALIVVASAAMWLVFAVQRGPASLVYMLCPFALGVAWSYWPRHALAVRAAPWAAAVFVLAVVVGNTAGFAFGLTPHAPTYGVMETVAALVALPVVAASLSRQSDAKDRAVGDLAYPLYLFHWPAWILAGKLVTAAPLAAAVAITAVLTAAGWAVDQSSEAYRRAWVERRTAAREPIAAEETSSRRRDTRRA